MLYLFGDPLAGQAYRVGTVDELNAAVTTMHNGEDVFDLGASSPQGDQPVIVLESLIGFSSCDYDYDDVYWVVTASAVTMPLSGDPEPVEEGSEYTLTLGEVTGTSETVTSYTIHWGDGSDPEIYTAAELAALNRQVSHTYADGPLETTITVDVTLEGVEIPLTAVTSKTVTVENVAPMLTVVDTQTVIEGGQLSLTDLGMFLDPGFGLDETFTYSIDWGDQTTPSSGTPTIDIAGSPGVLTEGSFDGTHSYASSGIYTVTVTLTDDDDGSDVQSFVVYNGIPCAATSVSATTVSNTQVSLTWEDTSSSELGFVIEKSTNGTDFEFAGWADANADAYTVTGLTADTQYWFRANVYNEIGLVPSVADDATTMDNLPLAPPAWWWTRWLTIRSTWFGP